MTSSENLGSDPEPVSVAQTSMKGEVASLVVPKGNQIYPIISNKMVRLELGIPT